MKLAIVLLVILSFSCGLRIVFAQPQQPDARKFIGYAENEIGNFEYWSQEYWFNLSQRVLYDSFTDIVNARRDVAIANSSLITDPSFARGLAAQASFAAKRANYRMFLYMTFQIVENANQTFYSIPDYIPKPADANATLSKAIQIYQASNMSYLLGPYSYPSVNDTWSTLNDLEYATEQLWSNDNSAAHLAEQVKAEVIAYLAQEEPVFRRLVAFDVNSIRSKVQLFAPITPAISLVLAFSAVSPLVGFFVGWFSGIFRITWDGDLFRGRRFRRLVGSLIIASASLQVAGCTYLLGLLSDLNGVASSYALALPTSILNSAQMVLYLAIFFAVACIVSSILNAGLQERRTLTGIVAIISMIFGIVSWAIAWGLSNSALLIVH